MTVNYLAIPTKVNTIGLVMSLVRYLGTFEPAVTINWNYCSYFSAQC